MRVDAAHIAVVLVVAATAAAHFAHSAQSGEVGLGRTRAAAHRARQFARGRVLSADCAEQPAATAATDATTTVADAVLLPLLSFPLQMLAG